MDHDLINSLVSAITAVLVIVIFTGALVLIPFFVVAGIVKLICMIMGVTFNWLYPMVVTLCIFIGIAMVPNEED